MNDSISNFSEVSYQKEITSKLSVAQQRVLDQVLSLLDNIDKNEGLRKEFKSKLLNRITQDPDLLDKLLENIEKEMIKKLDELKDAPEENSKKIIE